jgi:hypothetical protein
VEKAHYTLDRIQNALTRSNNVGASAQRIYRDVADLQTAFALPLRLQ